LSDRPEDLLTLDADRVTRVLSQLLELACRAQHVGNIELARRYLVSIPREWLLDQIEPLAEELITSGGEWEYRRLLELYERLDDDLLRRLVARGLLSDNEEIKEAAEDFGQRRAIRGDRGSQ
jgi:hypothetical protein